MVLMMSRRMFLRKGVRNIFRMTDLLSKVSRLRTLLSRLDVLGLE